MRLLALRSSLSLGLVLAASIAAPIASGYFSAAGIGDTAASATILATPTISSASPGVGSVSLVWSAVTAPGSGDRALLRDPRRRAAGGRLPHLRRASGGDELR